MVQPGSLAGSQYLFMQRGPAPHCSQKNQSDGLDPEFCASCRLVVSGRFNPGHRAPRGDICECEDGRDVSLVDLSGCLRGGDLHRMLEALVNRSV